MIAVAATPSRLAFDALMKASFAGDPWREERRRALERFEARGFPTTRDEDWRHTNPAPLASVSLERLQAEAAAPSVLLKRVALPGVEIELVFVDGWYRADLSLCPSLEGVKALSLAETARRPAPPPLDILSAASRSDHAFADLNLALAADGAWIEVAPGRVLEEPLHLVFLSSGGSAPRAIHPRVSIRMARGSQATVVESYAGERRYWTNAVTQIALDEGARLEFNKVQEESLEAFHTASVSVLQARDSRFTSRIIQLGGRLTRDDIAVRFAGEGADCALDGLFVAGGEQHQDTHSRIEHVVPHCSSRELYKGIVGGRARGVFHGRIVVGPGAQKTDAYQTNKNLLLSREALVHSTPQLEILADDVKCKHGSTTGQLDPTALFYLRSRGIGEEAARSLLTLAFASEVVRRIGVEALRRRVLGRLAEVLPGAPQEAVA